MTPEQLHRKKLKELGYRDEFIEETVLKYIKNCTYEFAEAYHTEQSKLFGVGITFTTKEKQILSQLVKTEGQTTLMNYSDKDWIEEYVNDRNKLLDKIESQTLPDIKETVIFAEEESDRIGKSKFTKYDKESYMFGLMDGVSWIREKIKCITFDKESQNNLSKEVKERMRKDREKAQKQQ